MERRFDATYLHFPISNDFKKYETQQREVRRWLNEVLSATAEQASALVFFHCTSGKDRTGVVVAAILKVLGVDEDLIVQEYLWSDGEVKREWIQTSLDGIGDPARYFDRVDLDRLRRTFA